jgi:hypothetical protein
MFSLKERKLYTYCAFVYWRKDDDSSDIADIIVFRDENPDPEIMEMWLPDDELYHTEIVDVTTNKPIPDPDYYENVLGTGYIFVNHNGCDCQFGYITMSDIKREDNYQVPVVGLKIIYR